MEVEKSVERSSQVNKLKVLSPVNDRFSMALDFITFLLAERSSLYDDQVKRHVAKWVSKLQFQMKAQVFDLMDPFFYHKVLTRIQKGV